MKCIITVRRRLCASAELYEMILTASEPVTAHPGQFLMIGCGEGTLLRRPISLAGWDPEANTLRICFEVRGKGTAALAGLKPGDTVDILPPAGHGFPVAETGRVLLCGGGIGIFPLLMLAKAYGTRADAVLGFRTASLACCTDEFELLCERLALISDDGSTGRQGFVTALAEEALAERSYDRIQVCGPKPMMRGIASLAERYRIPCDVSMEERMGCGVGACMACVCKTIPGHNSCETDGFDYKRVCADGPVFSASDILW